MYNLIALFGPAGSGKDEILNGVKEISHRTNIINKVIQFKISTTTRYCREKEINGKDYNFILKKDFEQRIERGEFLEYQIFNDWYYGTLKNSIPAFDHWNIGIYNINGIKQIYKLKDCNILPVFIKTDDKIRLLRQLNREKDPNIKEIIRRYKADNKDFQMDKIDFPFFIVDNNESNRIHITFSATKDIWCLPSVFALTNLINVLPGNFK